MSVTLQVVSYLRPAGITCLQCAPAVPGVTSHGETLSNSSTGRALKRDGKYWEHITPQQNDNRSLAGNLTSA